jgi:hypothetical protein
VKAVLTADREQGAVAATMFLAMMASSGGGQRWQLEPATPGSREGVRCSERTEGKGGAHRRAAIAMVLRLNPAG